MRWYVSYPILAAGLAFGFDTVFPDAPGASRAPSSDSLASTTAPLAEPVVVLAEELLAEEPAAASLLTRLAAFSPGPVLATARAAPADPSPPRPSVLDYLAAKLAPLDLAPIVVAPPPQPVTVAAWTSAVIPNAAVHGTAAKTDARREPLSRAALARDIQTELARVGCYLGEIDGVWGSGSKRAASLFMDRVNAALPMGEPDVFMLSLLRAQDDEVCGAACPQGQGLTASGRCVPSTILAQAGKDRGAPGARTMTTASLTPPPPRPVPYGRMGIGGPKPVETADAREAEVPTRTAALAVEDDAAAPDVERSEADAFLASPPAVKAAPSSFDIDPAPPGGSRKAKATSGRSKPVRAARHGSYRHVQRLFEHPLGRM